MIYAGFWIRLWAYVIDALILLPLWVIEKGFGLLANQSMALALSSEFLISTVAWWLYEAFFLSGNWQATPGKRLFELRVESIRGDRLTFARASGRYFAKYISSFALGIGFLMVGVTARKQGLHDKIFGTVVLRGKIGIDQVVGCNVLGASSSRQGQLGEEVRKWPECVFSGFDSNGHIIRLLIKSNDRRLGDSGLVIGRDPAVSDICIDDSTVSRRHARIYSDFNRFYIQDLQSSNGLEVDGIMVENSCREIRSGSKVAIGGVELIFGIVR